MEPEILDLPAFTVIGMEMRVTPGAQGIPALWGLFYRRLAEIPDVIEREKAYGVGRNWDPATRSFDYIAGVQARPGVRPPEGMTSVEIPAQTYAVFKFPLAGIHEAVHEANHVWLPASAYQRADGPEFELYGEEFNPGNPESPMYFCLPVVPR